MILRRAKGPLAIAALFLVPLLLYRAHARGPARANPLDRAVLFVSTPLERLLSGAIGAASERWGRYVDVVGARAENIELKRERAQSRRRLAELDALEKENAALRATLELRARRPELALVSASVIAAGRASGTLMVRIDRGLADGLARGQAVMTEVGLVGRIQRVAYTSAEVLLLGDDRVTVDVLCARSRARGRLRGVGALDRPLQVVDAPKGTDLRVGDLLLTGGFARPVPRGIAVGRVEAVEVKGDPPELHVEVAPLVDLTRLERVVVVVGADQRREPALTPEVALPPALKGELSPPRGASPPTGRP